MAEAFDDEWKPGSGFLTRLGDALPPWAVILWLVTQSAAGIWWAATMNERMAAVEHAQQMIEVDHSTLAGVQVQVSSIAQATDRIEHDLRDDERTAPIR